MEPKLQEIAVTELSAHKKLADKSSAEQILKLMPKEKLLAALTNRVTFRVSFVLDNAPPAYMNAIRMILIDYIETWGLEFRIGEDFHSDDRFCLSESVLNDVQNLSLDQDYDFAREPFEASLDVRNDTLLPIAIMSDDIVTKPAGLLPAGIQFGYLMPKKYLRIDAFQLSKKAGWQYGCHQPVNGGIYFDCLDVEPYDEEKGSGVPSSLSDPLRHILKYHTKSSTKRPLWPAIAACDYIIKESADIEKAIEEHDVNRVVVVSESDRTKVYIIENTFIHFGNLLVAIVKGMRKQCDRISCEYVHHEQQSIQITIVDDEHQELLTAGCRRMREQFQKFKKQFEGHK